MGKYDNLIKRLRNEAESPDNYPEDSILMREATDAIEELSAKYEKALHDLGKQAEPKWIPVAERLPESAPEDLEYPAVIGTFADGSVELVCYYESTKEWGGGEYFDRQRFPTHWMPLPEPPKEET